VKAGDIPISNQRHTRLSWPRSTVAKRLPLHGHVSHKSFRLEVSTHAIDHSPHWNTVSFTKLVRKREVAAQAKSFRSASLDRLWNRGNFERMRGAKRFDQGGCDDLSSDSCDFWPKSGASGRNCLILCINSGTERFFLDLVYQWDSKWK